MRDKQVENITQISLNKIRFPIIAVYKNPLDYPGKVVARVFDLNIPTEIMLLKETVEEMQQEIKKTGLVFPPRKPKEYQTLVGTWI